MTRFRYLRDVATLELDEGKCVGCGMCMAVCPHAVFMMNDDRKARIVDRDACMECGACALNCPAEALKVKAGVGCAAAVINSILGKTDGACCCSIEEDNASDGAKRPGCC